MRYILLATMLFVRPSITHEDFQASLLVEANAMPKLCEMARGAADFRRSCATHKA
jgi:hypothetical protein